MVLNLICGALTVLSCLLLLWQWIVAIRFPLHRRTKEKLFAPNITVFKPLKGADDTTGQCLRSWFTQDFSGGLQILFGVASAEDPVCEIVRQLLIEFPAADAQLMVCGPLMGPNAKVSKLAQLERLAKFDVFVVSDADTRIPPDFLANAIQPLGSPAPSNPPGPACGLINCFYSLANPTTLAMRCEAIAINADFWSQVLQAQSLKPLDFALGAVMITRRDRITEIGGFAALANCLADDYQLGKRIASNGHRILISTVVVECWSAPMGWQEVWRHQLRWARTIRVSQPLPYFFSILSNATLWPLVWLTARPSLLSLWGLLIILLARIAMALELQYRLTQRKEHFLYGWLAPVKDVLQAMIWGASFMGNSIEWAGQRMRLKRDGTLERESG